MVLKYYFDLMSQPSRAVWLFLKVNHIDFVECPVALRKGEHFNDEFAAVNPFKKVPAIDHNGFKLSESVAILQYLNGTCPNIPEHWYPKELKLKARVDEYMAWQHSNLRLYGSMYFRTRVLGPKPFKPESLTRWKTDLDSCLEKFEEVFLTKGAPFVNGAKDITIADLLAVCELEQPVMAGYDLAKERPVVKAYLDRVAKRVGPLYNEAHKFVWNVREQVAKGKL